METERRLILPWAYCSRDKSVEELGHCPLCTSLELENAQLRGLLERTIIERDEAQERYQKVLLENLLLQQQVVAAPPMSGVSSLEDEPRRVEKDSPNTFNGGFSPSDWEDSIVSSPATDMMQPPPSRSPTTLLDSSLAAKKPLPEKGNLLQAVIKAGPLLQTLLLAGPLPQWQHPPPALESSEIPPVKNLSQAPPARPVFRQDSLLMSTNFSGKNAVTSCGSVCNKRGLSEGLFDFPAETKYQRVALP